MSLLLCQREPYQREATCRVVSCAPEGDGYRVQLEDSLLYPEGGGQPPDHGTIAGVDVTDVQKGQDGLADCLTSAEVPVGEAHVIIDWQRRYDHMQQHSAQHLITAIANERLGYTTVGFHLGEQYCAIELDTPSIKTSELAQLSTWVNEAIREARPIGWRVVAPENFEAEGIRSRMLPKGHSGDLRIVEIEGIDKNTCGGTHVASTAELQMVGFLGIERIRKRVRLSFLAGNRLLQRFAEQSKREQQLTQRFNKAPDQHIAAVEHQQNTNQTLRRQLNDMERELAGHIAKELTSKEAALYAYMRPGASRQMLEAISNELLAQRPDALLLLGATNEPMAENDAIEGDGIFLCRGSAPTLVKTIGDIATSTLVGRGGGKPGTYQGKVTRMEAWDETIAQATNAAETNT